MTTKYKKVVRFTPYGKHTFDVPINNQKQSEGENQMTTTVKIVKPQMETMQYDAKKEIAGGTLKINNKTYKFTASMSYFSGKDIFKVNVEDFVGNMEKLSDLGVEVDFSEFEKEFNRLKSDAKLTEKERIKKERGDEYDNHIFVTKIIKEIPGAMLTSTRKDYINAEYGRNIGIAYNHVYKGSNISIDINCETTYSGGYVYRRSTGVRYVISRGYNRNEKTWCKDPEKIVAKFEEMLKIAQEKVEWKIKANQAKETLFEKVNEALDGKVENSKVCHRSWKGEWREEDAFTKNSVQFQVTDSTKGRMKYRLVKIEKDITTDQLNKILDILK